MGIFDPWAGFGARDGGRSYGTGGCGGMGGRGGSEKQTAFVRVGTNWRARFGKRRGGGEKGMRKGVGSEGRKRRKEEGRVRPSQPRARASMPFRHVLSVGECSWIMNTQPPSSGFVQHGMGSSAAAGPPLASCAIELELAQPPSAVRCRVQWPPPPLVRRAGGDQWWELRWRATTCTIEIRIMLSLQKPHPG